MSYSSNLPRENPEIALDLERIFSLASYVKKRCLFLSDLFNEDEMFYFISDTLESKTIGYQKDHIVTSAIHYTNHISNNYADDVFHELSLLTNLPIAYLRSEEGLLYALKIEGHELSRLSKKKLYSLPGTALIISIVKAYEIISLWNDILNETFKNKILDIWDSFSTSENLEEKRIFWGKRYSSTDKLIHSLITFESTKHINLVWHEANKLEKIIPNISATDMLSYGYIGLRTALRLYDPSLGFKFSTYACSRINGTIRDGIRSEHFLPKRLTTFSRQISAAENEIQQTLGRTPTLKELSEKMGIEISKLEIMPRLAAAASIEELTEVKGNTSWDTNPEDPLTLLLKNQQSLAISSALAKLTKDEMEAVNFLIIEAYSPQKIRDITGRAAKELRDTKDLALSKLRLDLRDWSPNFTEN